MASQDALIEATLPMPDLTYPGPNEIHRHRLANGITVLVYENFASQSVVIEGLVRAGALAETRAQAGLANMAAGLLMRGTASRSHDDVYEALEAVGAELGFSGGRHLTDFSAHGLAEDLDLMLDLLADTLRHPTFPERQVEQVRKQMLTGLQMRANNTQQMASLAFNDTLYENHPYGQVVTGYEDSVPTLTRDELMAFHRDYYGPQDMIITLVGAIKAETALEKITAVFGDWHNPKQHPLPDVPDVKRPLQTVRTHVTLPDKSQSDLIMGLPGPRRNAPDYLHASLMNTILGVFGMMGRIGKNVRETQGLAYYAYSRLNGGLGPSPWYAGAGVAPGNVERTIASICEEVVRIQDELVPEDEVADSKAFRVGSMPVSLETNSGLADAFCDVELYELGLDYLQRFPDLIHAITAEDVQAAAQKYLSPDQMVVAVAGPAVGDQ